MLLNCPALSVSICEYLLMCMHWKTWPEKIKNSQSVMCIDKWLCYTRSHYFEEFVVTELSAQTVTVYCKLERESVPFFLTNTYHHSLIHNIITK